MKQTRRILVFLLLLAGVAFACDFKIDPVAKRRFYRLDGWTLPDLEGGRLSAPVLYGVPLKFGPGPISGLTTRRVVLEGGAVFEIPKQEFQLDGKRQVMSSQVMVLQGIWRYDLDGKVVAYTVGLTPAVAHRENGKWKVDAEVGCIFYGTFIDDNADGIFPTLTPGWMMPELVPAWAQTTKKDPA